MTERGVRKFSWFADGMLRAELLSGSDPPVVIFEDSRYGWPVDSEHSIWHLRVEFDAQGGIARTEFIQAMRKRRDG